MKEELKLLSTGFMQVLIQVYKIQNYDGRRDGETIMFQGQILAFCKNLSCWIRFGKWIIRYYDVLWYFGLEVEESHFDIEKMTILQFKNELERHITKPFNEAAFEAQNWQNENYKRWGYAQFNYLTKKELDLVSDETINEFFDKAKKR